MKKQALSFAIILLSTLLSISGNAQTLTAPETHGVYGGRVLGMAVAQIDVDSVLIYISAESANSMFYTGAGRFSGFAGPVFRQHDWAVMPSLDLNAGYGSSISKIDAHNASGYVYFIHQSILYASHPSLGYNIPIDSMVQSLLIIDNYLLYVRNGVLPGETWLVHGTLNSSGSYTEDAQSPYVMGFSLTTAPTLIIDPTTNYPHLFLPGSSPQLMVIADSYDALSSSSIISSYLNADPGVTDIEWTTCGMGPDGRWLMAGGPIPGSSPSLDKYMAWTDDNGLSWNSYAFNVPGPPGGIPGSNFAYANVTSSNYELYTGAWASLSKGTSGSLFEMGHHHYQDMNKGNSGQVEADPIFDEMVYLTTNVGMGYAWPHGDTIFDYNNGFTAVQVHDMQMTDDFRVGFVASKSGIRKVNDLPDGAAAARWRSTIFPQYDGAPYYSIAFLDTNEVYAANHRIYKTTNGGALATDWTLLFDPTLGGAQGTIYNFPRYGVQVDGLRINPANDQQIMAGYNRTDGVNKGGLFISENAGSTWSQILLEATAVGADVNVTDVEWAIDWDGSEVCFVSVEYDAAMPQGQGVYCVKKVSGVWTVTHEILSPYSFYDLQLSTDGTTLFAAGFDGSEAFVQQRNLSSGPAWTSMSATGIQAAPSAMVDGDGFLFLAIDEKVYMTPLGSSSTWSLGYSYPIGTEINFLFYDDLLVGSSAGLFGHAIDSSATGGPSVPLSTDAFGHSVAISDDYTLIGAWGKPGSYAEAFDTSATNGPFDQMGAAYVYRRHRMQSNWIEWQQLLAQDRDSSDGFGYAVALNNSFAAVGAPWERHNALGQFPLDSAGSVYLYYRNAFGQYLDTAKLVPASRKAGSLFGAALHMNDEVLLVGAPGDTGKVFCYQFSGGQWNLLQILQAPDGQAGDAFGSSVSLVQQNNCDWYVVGAPRHDLDSSGTAFLNNAGSVYLWKDEGFGIQYFGKLVAAHRQPFASFGFALAAVDSAFLVAAPFDRTDASDANELDSAGAVYGFSVKNGSFAFKLVTNDRQVGDGFGMSLASHGDRCYVGLPGRNEGEGKVFTYRMDWTSQTINNLDRTSAVDSASGAAFGWAMAADDSLLVVGAPWAQSSGYGAQSTLGGAAYFYAWDGSALQSVLATQPLANQTYWPVMDAQEGSIGATEWERAERSLPYPNPTDGLLQVKVKTNAKLVLRDQWGRTLGMWRNLHQQDDMIIDLSEWSSGLYLLEIQQGKYDKLELHRIFKR